MPNQITHETLLAMGIPKPTLHGLLHKLVLAKSYSTKQTPNPATLPIKAKEKFKSSKILPLLAVGRWTNGRQPFGSSLTFFLSFLCQDKKGKDEKLGSSEITYETLLAMGIPKATLHRILHHFVLQIAAANNTLPNPNPHPFRIWQYYKNLQLKNRLCTNAPSNNSLSLLKTNFAKKPKNPV